MAAGRNYLAVLPCSGAPADSRQKMHLEMLNYLDDRRWPVRVFYHDQLPRWVGRSRLLSHVIYGFRMLFSRADTLIVDSSLLAYLMAHLLWNRLTGRRVLVSMHGPWEDNRVAWFERLALMWADLVLVDSRQTCEKLAEAGIPPRNLRVLSCGDWSPAMKPYFTFPSFDLPFSDFKGTAFRAYGYAPRWKKVRKRFGHLISTLSE